LRLLRAAVSLGLAKLSPQRRPVDTERLGRPTQVSVVHSQRMLDGLSFHAMQRPRRQGTARERTRETRRLRLATVREVQVAYVDGASPRDGIRASQHVAQLADVSRPVTDLECLPGASRQPGPRPSENVIRQGNDVFAPVAERRNLDLKAAKPVVEVLPQFAAGEHGLGRRVGRRNEAHGPWPRRLRAYRT